MFSLLKKVLGILTTNHYRKHTEISLFSGSAYFSSRVSKTVTDKWVEYGGEISSGATLDLRARYFFATDPSDPWVTKLFSKSVVVIHAGWILHCIDDAFQVPISRYILDEKFMPGLPYKLIIDASESHAPFRPSETTGAESAEHGPTIVQTSDTPSTPTSLTRKRKREQAYFDSPSGSLIFSGFDKDGMPLRPRKQRKLQFGVGTEVMRAMDPYWLRDHYDPSRDDDKYGAERGLFGCPPMLLQGHMSTLRAPDTPDKPLSHGGPLSPYRHFSTWDRPLQSTHSPSLAVAADIQKKTPTSVRTIDFTNPPPPTGRWRFRAAVDATKPRDTLLSITKSIDRQAKMPKKISFADHARVCVYTASSHSTQRRLGEDSEDEPEMDAKTLTSSDRVEPHTGFTAEAIEDPALQTRSSEINDCPARRLGGDLVEHDTLTLTMEDVEKMRHRLLELAAANGVEDGQLATLFELGGTFRGMAFRHVW